MSILVISTSLSANSRSALMARAAFEHLQQKGVECDWLDLRETPLPLCDAGPSYAAEHVSAISSKILHAKGIILASAIYNFDVNAAAKTLLELTGRNWTGKVVGIIVAAGGMGSYMSPMSLVNSLMLDFRCVILPRFVYGMAPSFDGNTISDAELLGRITQLADSVPAFAAALDGLTETPPL